MPDPATFSAAAIGAAALTEGIKFLYKQAGELLKRWREKRDAANKIKAEDISIMVPEVFGGGETTACIQFEDVAKAEESLRALRKELAEYAEGTLALDPTNPSTSEQINALRALVEAILHRPLIFEGEVRDPSQPTAFGKATVDEILGYVAGLRIGTMKVGTAHGEVHSKKVGPGGRAVGTQIDIIE